MNGMHFSVFLAGLNVIIRVELPFRTKLHLLGIPTQKMAVQLDPGGEQGSMERVTLEGDFPSYFTLYADNGQQAEARYVFPPDTMQYVVEFCQSHSWEIIHDELYFVQSVTAKQAKDDPTLLWDDVDTFVEAIRPALDIELTPQQKNNRIPYGHERREHLDCPICNEQMPNEGGYFQCPKKHGALVHGRILGRVRSGELRLNQQYEEHPKKREHNLECTACGHEMQQVAYSGTSIIIDTCTHCPYRWLDSHDLIVAA
ncbi:MAG: hypothetical protein R3313_04325 [Candidatus Saccharimonadales bacterium]|nr:hypothetical protein [Candidatus Saccharimonadales bacterium]